MNMDTPPTGLKHAVRLQLKLTWDTEWMHGCLVCFQTNLTQFFCSFVLFFNRFHSYGHHKKCFLFVCLSIAERKGCLVFIMEEYACVSGGSVGRQAKGRL